MAKVGASISFDATMFRAIIFGAKTQTRRPGSGVRVPLAEEGLHFRSKYGEVGSVLWAKEPWAAGHRFDLEEACDILPTARVYYEASEPLVGLMQRPARTMPRWASRMQLRVCEIKIQRLQDISEKDAVEEGFSPSEFGTARDAFELYWKAIYGASSWDKNVIVWAIKFAKVKEAL